MKEGLVILILASLLMSCSARKVPPVQLVEAGAEVHLSEEAPQPDPYDRYQQLAKDNLQQKRLGTSAKFKKKAAHVSEEMQRKRHDLQVALKRYLQANQRDDALLVAKELEDLYDLEEESAPTAYDSELICIGVGFSGKQSKFDCPLYRYITQQTSR